MIEFEIDGKTLAVEEGRMIIEAADAAGIYIPRFCYHKKLSIAANCRMCLVEVEKSKKPVPACATPVTSGLKVYTRSPLAVDAQRAVMEFLLINHPLDCPICDQGGECELQDLAMGYGKDISRYTEGKRSIFDEDLGPLIATDMTRCIQCTRCVRFGTEIAGLRELGATGRGEDMRIGTYVKHTLESEMSGNIIDICPVGALTSKPFRFQARAWELRQHASISPHDCIGSHLYVHSRGYEYSDYRRVMRVVPRDQEDINETWISDRDRFSYEALNNEERLSRPMIKQDGKWLQVDWVTALNYTVDTLRGIIEHEGKKQIAGVASPSSTLEEFYLLQKLFRGLGCHNVDHRIHQLDFNQQEKFPFYPTLGCEIAALEKFETVLLIGSDIRHEQPIASHRLRKASLNGANILSINPVKYDFNFSQRESLIIDSDDFVVALAQVLKSLAEQTGGSLSHSVSQYVASVEPSPKAVTIAKYLSRKSQPLILLGAHAQQHPHATLIYILAKYIAELSHAKLGCLTTGANSAGAWIAGCIPHRGPASQVITKIGLDASTLFEQKLQAYILLNVEPELDCAKSSAALEALQNAQFVVSLTPFRGGLQEQYAHVILPVAPFYETSGTFINAEGRWQSFDAVGPAYAEVRPAWKVLRVLGNLFKLEGFDYVSSEEICAEVKSLVNAMPKIQYQSFTLPHHLHVKSKELRRIAEWPMYCVDNLVRKAKALQATLAKEFAAVYIHPKLAEKLQLKAGDFVVAIQHESQVQLPIVIDDRIPGDIALIPAGLKETAGFGVIQGPLKLIRSTETVSQLERSSTSA